MDFQVQTSRKLRQGEGLSAWCEGLSEAEALTVASRDLLETLRASASLRPSGFSLRPSAYYFFFGRQEHS